MKDLKAEDGTIIKYAAGKRDVEMSIEVCQHVERVKHLEMVVSWAVALLTDREGREEFEEDREYLYVAAAVQRAMEYGLSKYQRGSWKRVPAEHYILAATRHIYAYIEGEALDPESGLSHLDHALCCAYFAKWLMNPPKVEDADE